MDALLELADAFCETRPPGSKQASLAASNIALKGENSSLHAESGPVDPE
jgi:hypothetical protein